MTSINLERPRDGARLGLPLVLLTTKQMVLIGLGSSTPMRIQLANHGGAIPVLTVEPGSNWLSRRPITRIRFYDPDEGCEIASRATTLQMHMLMKMLGKG